MPRSAPLAECRHMSGHVPGRDSVSATGRLAELYALSDEDLAA